MKDDEKDGIGRLWVFFDRWRFYAVNYALVYFSSVYFNLIQSVKWHAYLLFSITTISALLDFRFVLPHRENRYRQLMKERMRGMIGE